MGTYVALLRGINVGGNNMLPMRELVATFEGAGCARVRHYIQSGNVVFDAPAPLAARVPGLVRTAIEKRAGLRVPVVLRTSAELAKVASGNPFLAQKPDAKALHVLFLADVPGKEECAALDPERSPPDRFLVRGREVYLLCPHGVGKSKLTNAYFDGALGTTSTARNWRTVLTLVDMCAG